jgi:hypothetical protein
MLSFQPFLRKVQLCEEQLVCGEHAEMPERQEIKKKKKILFPTHGKDSDNFPSLSNIEVI